jgi:hypothetical protein
MTLCVVAYPVLKAVDRDWIQSIRRQFDPQYEFIDPHFTLLFPTQQANRETLEAHVRACVWSTVHFPFVLRCALPVKDAFSPLTHLFLAPDEGFSNLVRLHDILYSGTMMVELNLNIPYIPHITVGAFNEASACKHAADILNERSFSIEGTIECVNLLSVDDNGVTSLSEIMLSSSQRPPSRNA